MSRIMISRLTLGFVIGVAVLLLCGLGLEQSLPHIARPFWEDEIHHNHAILASHTLLDLPKNIKHHYQPLLEYIVRMHVWFPLLGHSELSCRLPSLTYRMLVIATAFGGCLFYLRRRGQAVALALSFLSGLWIVHIPQETFLSVEARHYALVSLMSLGWGMIAFFPDRPRRGPLLAASFLFANTHFFALPLILAVYLMEMAENVIRREPRRLLLWNMTALTATVCLTILINFKTLYFSFQYPPTAERFTLTQGIASGLRIWWEYQAYLALPVPALALWLCLMARFRQANVRKLLACIFLLMPAFFIYLRLRTTYTFSPRYYTPFLGVGVVSVLFFMDGAVEKLQQLMAWGQTRWLPRAGEGEAPADPLPLNGSAGAVGHAPPSQWISLAAAGVFSVCLILAAGAAYRQRDRLVLPPWNFSPYYHNYEALKAETVPIFLVTGLYQPGDLPFFYLYYVGQPLHADCRVQSMACAMTDPAAVRQEMRAFLEEHPEGVIALDGSPGSISPAMLTEPAKPPRYDEHWRAALERGVRVEETAAFPSFLWKVRGARTVDDIAAIAKAVGFTTRPGLFP